MNISSKPEFKASRAVMNTTEAGVTQGFTFGSKAETLYRIRPLITKAQVPELYFFTAEEWMVSRQNILNAIGYRFDKQILAVRSSALTEDCSECSMAGAFLSKLYVDSADRAILETAIDQVVQSMTGNNRDQVLVQPMVDDVAVSGVIMTFDIVHGAPYYCIDFDDESGRTDLVTSGNSSHKSLFVYRHAEDSMIRSARVALFLQLAHELERICECAALDIEFGMNKAGYLFLFQVRRIVLSRTWHPVTERRAKRQLAYIESFVQNRSRRQDSILGDRTVLAIMPDWNPAEIIGTTPRPLAASLYRELITKAVWCQARASMGYRPLGDAELMVIINNHPYIDVRNSFNSFIPANLPDVIGEMLINAWLARLEDNPELHDKVEFEVVPTCMDFCFVNDFKARYPGVLNSDEAEVFVSELRRLTCDSLNPDAKSSTLDRALETAAGLDRMKLPGISDDDAYGCLARADFLLATCRKLGTLPFAIVARHAFIAEALLRSAVRRGALTERRLTEFRRSIRTITGKMVEEFSMVCQGNLSREDFLRRYGHLRPGTYEITSMRYDERDDLFLGDMPGLPPTEASQFKLSNDEIKSINLLLAEAGLNVLSSEKLFDYARKAIAGREYVKFTFTRILSNALSMVMRWGGFHGLSRDDISYLDWPVIARCLSHPVMDDVDRYYLDIAEISRRSMAGAHALRFAHIIFNTRDIYVATLNRSVPNYVGIGSVTGAVVQLEANTPTSISIKDKIVCIENADPGFDWIFTKSPGALITRFGGANSHMAVRCAELELPAAIGCGDQTYDRIVKAARVELNCAENILRPVYAS
jgi:phosphohistidine swiveling domain-containing protein